MLWVANLIANSVSEIINLELRHWTHNELCNDGSLDIGHMKRFIIKEV